MKSCNSKSISPCLSRVLPSEVEVLESIYLDELQVVKGNGRYVFQLEKGRSLLGNKRIPCSICEP